MKQYLLAHDLGTSGNKATLYSTSGELIKSRTYAYDTHFFNQNWAEQDPSMWWQAVVQTTKDIIEGINAKDILAVAFSGQMQGCVCIDKEGKPLRPAVIWADQRAQKETEQITGEMGIEKFYRITGHRPSPAYSIEKLMWIKNNEPDIYHKTYKMLLCKDYMIFKLTGQYVTDYSDASGTNALDLNTMNWSEDILRSARIDRDKLPDIRASTQVVGGVTASAAHETGLMEGTPIVCGGGDGACAAVGAASTRVGNIYSCMGSSAWIALTTREPIYDEKMRIFNFAHIIPGLIMPCGTMQTGGAAYSWLKNQLGRYEVQEAERLGISPYELINDAAKKSPPGANGLIYLPYLLGERSPRWNRNAKAAFIGLKMETRREDIFRSVVEGIMFNMYSILECFKEHHAVEEMTVIGGGASSPLWRQVMADVYGAPILKPNYLEEATSMGAAVTAGVGIGVFEDFNVINKFIKIEDTILPIHENREVYAKMHPIFEQSYHALREVYEKLAEL